MKNKGYGRAFLPIFIVFIIISLLIISIPSTTLLGWKVDGKVLLGGNEILFIVTAISYWLHVRSLNNSNPHVFVRMVFGSLIIKMIVCLVAVFLYAWRAPAVNKYAILGSGILYVIYTTLEVRTLTQMLQKVPKNA